jgi:hypothetical protein
VDIRGIGDMSNSISGGPEKTETAPQPVTSPYQWMTDDEYDNLLGNARPKTIADIENSGFWSPIFDRWAQAQGGDVAEAHTAWKNGEDGAREALKNAGPNEDLRTDFYNELTAAKGSRRDLDISSGAAERRIDDALGI